MAAGGALALLAACSASDSDPGPGEMTVGETRALDEAAEMLDEQRLPPKPAPAGTPSPEPPPAGE